MSDRQSAAPSAPREQARRNTRARFEQWANNPACHANTLSAVHNVRMDRAAERAGFVTTFGQSPFAIARGDAFERGLFRDDASRLREALQRTGSCPDGASGFTDLRLRVNGGPRLRDMSEAIDETSRWLHAIADGPASGQLIAAAPTVRIPRGVILPEALLIIDFVTVVAGASGPSTLTVGEVKVFPDRGGHTDPRQLASARAQAGLYQRALSMTVDHLGLSDRLEVASTGHLVFTWPGSNRPTVRPHEQLEYQAHRAERGFARLEEVAGEIVRDDDFAADQPALLDRVLEAPTDYAEACLGFCDLAPRCHASAVEEGRGITLGTEAGRMLGSTPIDRAIDLLDGWEPEDEREQALALQLVDGTTAPETARRLRAWKAGRPLPRYATLHHAIAAPDAAMVVAFVRMAGESRPWGIAWGHPGADPEVLSVDDARVRDDVAALCAMFAEDLLAHFDLGGTARRSDADDAKPVQLRQLWLPNGQHLEMLDQLTYAYARTDWGGADRVSLNALGRLCGWLFRESSRRGSQHVVDASAGLRAAYVSPAQDLRQAHLGYLLALLTTKGTRDDRLLAAAEAERASVSPTMNPEVERDELADSVDRMAGQRRDGVAPAGADQDQVTDVLRRELVRRWSLTRDAYTELSQDGRSPNQGVTLLVQESLEELWWRHVRREVQHRADDGGAPPFVPHPETDHHGSAAADAYLRSAAADERYVNALIHDDEELLDEALAGGQALRGRVTRVFDADAGRRKRPTWCVDLDVDSIGRLRVGSRMRPYGCAGHGATLVQITRSEASVRVQLEWTDRKTLPLTCGVEAPPLDESWVGETLAFVMADAADLTKRRVQRVWSARQGPGSWLTHGAAPPVVALEAADGGFDGDLDDVRQLENAT